MFCGKGAGELPTASACVADVMECIQEQRHRPEIGWSPDESGFVSPLELKDRWYFRTDTSLSQQDLPHGAQVLESSAGTAFITDYITGHEAQALKAKLSAPACLRVLD